jgi:phosphatidylglycerophosphate synthase
MNELNYFSERERAHQAALRQKRDRLFAPLVRVLAPLKLHPDAISFAGVALLVPAVWLYGIASWVTYVCLGLYVFCDALDGPYARLTGKVTRAGSLTDLVCDQVGPVVISLMLLAHGVAPALLAGAYAALYLSFIALLTTQHAFGVPVQPVFRSKYFLFLFVLLDDVFALHWVGHLMLVCSVQMLAFGTWSFVRIRRHLSRPASAADPAKEPPPKRGSVGELIAFWLVVTAPLAILPWAEPALAWFSKPV